MKYLRYCAKRANLRLFGIVKVEKTAPAVKRAKNRAFLLHDFDSVIILSQHGLPKIIV
jgi:hypothetical protein